MRDRSLVVLILALLCAYLVKCLTSKEETGKISPDLMKEMTSRYSRTFSQATRDSRLPSESLPRSEIEPPSEKQPSIDLSDLPETARWADEEEQEVLTVMP